MARNFPVKNLVPQNVGSINDQLLAVITEVAQSGTPGCSRPQLATDNGVRDQLTGRTPTLMGSAP